METAFEFETIAREGEARATMLRTRRGIIETPVFMPVGTAITMLATAKYAWALLDIPTVYI